MTATLCLWLLAALVPLGGDNLPPVRLADLAVFPPYAVVDAAYDFNLACKRGCEAHLKVQIHPLPEEEQLVRCWQRCELLHYIYDALRDAANPKATDQWRLERLAVLRELIGMRAYYEGCLPPPAPLEYWRER